MEGIMMRGPKKQAIVINTDDTKEGFVVSCEDVTLPKDRFPLLGIVFIRGIANFIHTIMVGMKALTYSTEFALEGASEEEGESKFDKWLNEKLGKKNADKVIMAIAVVLAIVLVIGLFMFLPTFLAGLLANLLYETIDSNILRNVSEGIIRIVIFIIYLWFSSRLKDIERVWGYHGAEHKAIYCYEKRLPLTVENVREQSTRHPRCGTSFLFVVILVSILVFSFTTVSGVWMRVGMRLLLLPIVIAISYEIIRVAGRYDNTLTRIITAPGRALQRLTTSEPDDVMIETAIEALSHVIPENSDEARLQ